MINIIEYFAFFIVLISVTILFPPLGIIIFPFLVLFLFNILVNTIRGGKKIILTEDGKNYIIVKKEGYKILMRDGVEIAKGIDIATWKNKDYGFTDKKGIEHLMRDWNKINKLNNSISKNNLLKLNDKIITQNLKEKELPLLFFDTETTGFLCDREGNMVDPGELIQLGYRKILDGTNLDYNKFYYTDEKIQISAIAIHNITNQILKEKSKGIYLTSDEIETLNIEFKNSLIIAHNLPFDLQVLDKVGIKYGKNCIDTLRVSEILRNEGIFFNNGEEPEKLNLQYLRYFFEIDNLIKDENTTAHDAFGDVIVLEQIFYKLKELIKNKLSCNDEIAIEKMILATNTDIIFKKDKLTFGKYKNFTLESVYNIDPGYLNWIIKNFDSEKDKDKDILYTAEVLLGLKENNNNIFINIED